MSKFIDLTGQRFGRLVPRECVGSNQYKASLWLCECDCGNIKIVVGQNLKSGNTNSCGCLHSEKLKQNFIDLTDQKFGKLVVIKYIGQDNYRNSLWLCLCECGKEKIISGYNLKRGQTRSCGCLMIEKTIMMGKNNITHGHSLNKKVSKTYSSWRHMKERCNNKKCKDYKNYGGRGIKICERWLDKNNGFQNFLEDMGECPPGLSLDRIDNNKLINGYSPNNCRWATPKQQANNQRSNLDERSLLIRKYERKLRNAVWRLRLKNKNIIVFSKYLPYNSKQLYDHLENIRSFQNNCCPMCNKSYDEIKYDLDHTIPTSSAETKEELLKLFNLNNLSLLCYKCNRYIKRKINNV